MVVRISDKTQNYSKVTKLLVKPFIVSYMLEDDYDMTAYNRLISHIDDVGVEVIGKGVHGRHNDDTYSIVAWFKNQYDDILKSDFNRGEPNEE